MYPKQLKDVAKVEIPIWIQKFGGKAVIKIPYSNAGQGVFTITNEQELETFMSNDYDYDQFIVQSMIGHYNWSSYTEKGHYYHIGTLPNKKGKTFVADLRLMVISTPIGISPVAIYARRAKSPLEEVLPIDKSSWDMLGTNLSEKLGKNEWSSDVDRLIIMDQKDFNSLGVGIDDLISGYIQTALSVIAIDRMSLQLQGAKTPFRMKLFKSLDNDEALVKEIRVK